ncbi:hypothetical protein IIY66_03300 [Candidatus Saccharibacteria bacterium]|nr:hypothetical protein [Candidatus Saccharibacteria bacterium]
MEKTWKELYSSEIMKECHGALDMTINLAHNKRAAVKFWNWYYTVCSKECPGYAISEDEYKTVLDIITIETHGMDLEAQKHGLSALEYHLNLIRHDPTFEPNTCRSIWMGDKAIEFIYTAYKPM